jgi:hypothetical protein
MNPATTRASTVFFPFPVFKVTGEVREDTCFEAKRQGENGRGGCKLAR